jgi:hypothetical protein
MLVNVTGIIIMVVFKTLLDIIVGVLTSNQNLTHREI